MIEKINYITSIFAISSTAISTIMFILQKIKTSKKNELVELAKIVQKIPQFINEAEQIFKNENGKIKKNYVTKEIQNECLLKDIEYETRKEQFENEIENILSTPQKKEK